MSEGREINPARLRNLVQYRDLTDEEFQEKMELLVDRDRIELDERIQEIWQEFEKEYDIDDLKINDREVLRGMITDIIALEELQLQHVLLRRKASSDDQVLVNLDRLTRVISNIQTSISNAQQDLKITRKIRQSDKESSVLEYIEKLNEKAKKFSKQTMVYIFCPKCNMLLGTVWTQDADEKKNSIKLVCNREMEDGSKCNTTVVEKISEVYARGGVNVDEVPEFFKS